jgi:hypothetical protein
MKQYNCEQIIKAMQNKNYKVFLNDKKPFNLNIVGIRSNDKTPNIFNDLLNVFWCYGNKWHEKHYKITTDPGLYWLKNPENVNGTAILKPGRYKELWQIGLHQGRYEALVQVNPCTVIRDYDRDNVLDYNSGREETGIFGINLHHAGENSQLVDKWSGGCQVFANLKDFNEFIQIAKLSAEEFGNSFTYILLEESDF